jgi:hypothetical protein
VTGGVAQHLDLLVDVVEAVGARQEQGGDAQARERVDDPVAVARQHDEVGLLAADGLDVGPEPAHVRQRRAGRVVRALVDRDHLRPRLEREEHLGERGGQRHDALRCGGDLDVAVLRGHRHRERGFRGGGRRGAGVVTVVVAAGGGAEQEGRGDEGSGEAADGGPGQGNAPSVVW